MTTLPENAVEVTKQVSGSIVAREVRVIKPHICGSCGVLWGMDAEYEAERRKDAKTFYCPNGCQRAYVKSEADRVREELARKQRDLDGALDRLATAERSRAAIQGEVTKLKNRAANGVCPDCHRTFKELSRHMRSKHQGKDAAAKLAEEMRGNR